MDEELTLDAFFPTVIGIAGTVSPQFAEHFILQAVIEAAQRTKSVKHTDFIDAQASVSEYPIPVRDYAFEDVVIGSGYYVYLHRKKTDGSVFYVGKGNGRRAWDMRARNNLWGKIAKKYGVYVEIHSYGLQEWYAYELEESLIDFFGRKNSNQGCLANLVDGGMGAKNLKHTKEARARMVESSKKRWTEEARAAHSFIAKEIVSRPHVKEKIRQAQKKAWGKYGHAEKMSAALKNAWKNAPEASIQKRDENLKKFHESHKTPVMCVETKEIFESKRAAVFWLKSIGNAKAAETQISRCIRKNSGKTYGYSWSVDFPRDKFAGSMNHG